MTSFYSYGSVAPARQAEIIHGLAAEVYAERRYTAAELLRLLGASSR